MDDEFVELPRPLTGRDVTLFLDPFGFHASTQMDWQKGALEQIRQIVVRNDENCNFVSTGRGRYTWKGQCISLKLRWKS